MRYIAVSASGGMPSRTIVHRIEAQNRVRLVGQTNRGYLLEGTHEDCAALLNDTGAKLEPCYPAGT